MNRTIHVPGGNSQIRDAVLTIVESPALRTDVTVDATAYSGVVTIEQPPYPLSPGQSILWSAAESIAGSGSVHLLELLTKLDTASITAVSDALRVAAGLEVPA